jgi:nucleoside-diphosphate-sugar epimerase
MLANKPVACTAGTQKRDFMYVGDAAQALVELVQSELTGLVNIASGSAVAVREVVEHIASVFGKPELIEFGARPTPANEPPLLLAKVDRLRNELHWTPKHSLARGLATTIAWWRTKLEIATINAKPEHRRGSQAA